MNSREAFLGRVRQAVVHGNRAGRVPLLPDRGRVGYQGAAPDVIARFCEELKNAGGHPHVASNREAVWQWIREVVGAKAAPKILLGRGGLVDRLDLPALLRREGLAVTTVDMLQADGSRPTPCAQANLPVTLDTLQTPSLRDALFAADIGISNVAYLVAETGSVVMAAAPEDPRSLSLLPPVHIALAEEHQLLPDLFDLFDLFSPLSSPGKQPPSCLTVITGPSKTGDIELRLVTGVHGPGEIHVVVCTSGDARLRNCF